mgnify:FL=1
MMEEQWYKATYGYPEITIETPEILEVQSVQLPENGVSTIGDFSIYTYGSPISNFYVAVSTTNFIIELDEMDLDVGITGALNAMEKQLNTRFTNVKKKNINIDGVRGKTAEVEYKRMNESTQLKEDYKLTKEDKLNSGGFSDIF